MHRTRLNYEQADKGVGALEEIADLVAPVLGWDAERRTTEIDAYRERAEAEDAAALEPDDASAETVRLRAADLAPLVEQPLPPRH
jgi:glycerol-3-phosphate dehydrogenase